MAILGFIPSEWSTSTGVMDSHVLSISQIKELSAHLCTEVLFDLHLYSDTETSDLDNEAFCIYKKILESEKTPLQSERKTSQPDSPQPKAAVTIQHSDSSLSVDEVEVPATEQSFSKDFNKMRYPSAENSELVSSTLHGNDQSETCDDKTPDTPHSLSQQSATSKTVVTVSPSSISNLPTTDSKDDEICKKIFQCFQELNNLLKAGKKMPAIKKIKKLCHLIDAGGQRAFLELLPTVTVGKALYLLFFSYEQFERKKNETVQIEGSPTEICTGIKYDQMDVIMQSLVCVSTSRSTTSSNVALLVGTHADRVNKEEAKRVEKIISDKVKPFIGKSLVMAGKEELILNVAIDENSVCSNKPEDYKNTIMKTVESTLHATESETLPGSWYMFSLILRRLEVSGHSVLTLGHCQEIADRLFIKPSQLQSLLSRLHSILGIIVYFPEVPELRDTVICNPALVYESISALIFDSYNETTPTQYLRLKWWGIFSVQELVKFNRPKKEKKGNKLEIDKLLVILQHLGIIAPIETGKSTTTAEEISAALPPSIHPDYIIPCRLNDAPSECLKLQIDYGQCCSIIPLRIYFKCGFSPMGGFCYLFSKLITNNHSKGWELLLPEDCELRSTNDIYWRNKVTFKINERYFVTLLSTNEYYEMQIVSTQYEKPFQLGKEGHEICSEVWSAINSVLKKSTNSSLQEYTTACQCTLHHSSELDCDGGHMMRFSCNPDEMQQTSRVTAECLQNKDKPISVPVDEGKQSVIVWFKVCTLKRNFYSSSYFNASDLGT